MPYLDVKNGDKILLDTQDYEIAKNYKWEWITMQRGNRCVFTYAGKTKAISAVVFGAIRGSVMHHKNNDITDFRRENIVICSQKELGHLTGGKSSKDSKKSQFNGVSFKDGHWAIRDYESKSRPYKYYQTENDAAIVADLRAVEKYGDKARQNFPELTLDELKKRCSEIEQTKKSYIKNSISKGNQGAKPKTGKKTSKFVGVYYDRARSKWLAEITFQRKKIYLGRFDKEVEAARAYDRKARELYGEGARVNLGKLV